MAVHLFNSNESGKPGTPVLGIHKLPKRILGLPDGLGKVRIRMREKDIATIFFRYDGQTCRFKAAWAAGGLWQIAAFTGVNSTVVSGVASAPNMLVSEELGTALWDAHTSLQASLREVAENKAVMELEDKELRAARREWLKRMENALQIMSETLPCARIQ